MEELLDILSAVSNDVNCWDAKELQQTIAPLINWSDGDTAAPFSSQSAAILARGSKVFDSKDTGHTKQPSASSPARTWPRYPIGRRAPSRPIPPIRD